MVLFSMTISSTSYSDWKYFGENKQYTFYIDYERVKKDDKYIYFWYLVDFKKPINEYFSAKSLFQVDCKILRFKELTYANHELPFGKDVGDVFNNENPIWEYATPKSFHEAMIKKVCEL